MPHDPSTGPTRRELMCRGCAALALTACAPAGGGPPQYGDDGTPPPSDDTAAGSTPPFTITEDGYPCDTVVGGGWTELPLAQYPELATVGGWVAVSAGGRQIAVAHVEDGCYVAIDRPCPHEGVLIEYREARNQFICPRHGSIFQLDGNVVGGPAYPLDLAVFDAARQGDSIFVNI